jgi:hypothetical protein
MLDILELPLNLVGKHYPRIASSDSDDAHRAVVRIAKCDIGNSITCTVGVRGEPFIGRHSGGGHCESS